MRKRESVCRAHRSGRHGRGDVRQVGRVAVEELPELTRGNRQLQIHVGSLHAHSSFHRGQPQAGWVERVQTTTYTYMLCTIHCTCEFRSG